MKLTLIALTVLAALWYAVTRAPFYLPPTDAATPALPDGPARVFGFATLTNPLVRLVVVGRWVPAEPARLRGWRRGAGRNIVEGPDMVLDGVVFTVSPQEMLRLDRYERTGRRYRRDLMMLEDGSSAWVYRLIGTQGLEAVED
ncbi:gamma-glutamylcyclotransferase family protein [Roseibaca sp. Y0-43]|uniref:gamma-glutamylcyclotransferase family protein n=1 Tax=Roseibaca sp. Y0-43 TaxID=2816854 RepID=UPI001D0C024A|nr:gamma-glutamylcyclotransferase family protein [Roseibaca sp. Y0-43]MCC1482346.1 gamma-glutamylcyclotransferase [Roseibaca sp. Y0-43]